MQGESACHLLFLLSRAHAVVRTVTTLAISWVSACSIRLCNVTYNAKASASNAVVLCRLGGLFGRYGESMAGPLSSSTLKVSICIQLPRQVLLQQKIANLLS